MDQNSPDCNLAITLYSAVVRSRYFFTVHPKSGITKQSISFPFSANLGLLFSFWATERYWHNVLHSELNWSYCQNAKSIHEGLLLMIKIKAYKENIKWFVFFSNIEFRSSIYPPLDWLRICFISSNMTVIDYMVFKLVTNLPCLWLPPLLES